MRDLFSFFICFALSHALAHGAFTGTSGGSEAINLSQPYQKVQYIIAIDGFYPGEKTPSRYDEAPILGEVRLFLGEDIPDGWLPCDGRKLPINQHMALYSLLDHSYGGSGHTNFRIPDLRGRVPVSVGPDLPLGTNVGGEPAPATADQLPPHSHATEGVPTETAGLGAPISNQMPGLALNIMIITGQRGGGAIYEEFGDIFIFAGINLESRFVDLLPLDGAALKKRDYDSLYSRIGDIYDTDTDNDTFRIPDLRHRTLTHYGTREALTDRDVGESFGTNALILSEAQLPPHVHSFGAGVTEETGNAQPIATWQDTLALAFYVYTIDNPYDSTVAGEIRIKAIPADKLLDDEYYYLPLNGQIKSTLDFPELYPVIGKRYGGSAEDDTFQLPNFIGQLPMGGTAEELGQEGGSESIILSSAQMPAHEHEATALPPVVLTHSASQVGYTTATIHGSVNPRGFATDPYFDIGADTTVPDELSTDIEALSGTSAIDVTLELSDLEPETTYFFRAAARNVSHDIKGDILQFSTGTYLDQWREDVFETTEINEETADMATPFDDGIPNLLRFATAIEPGKQATFPRAETTPEGGLSILYQRRDQIGDSVQLVVEWTTSLEAESWSTEGVIETVIASENGIETVSALLPEDDSNQQFGRLRVVRTE